MTVYRIEPRWSRKRRPLASGALGWIGLAWIGLAMMAATPAFAQLPAIRSEPLPPVPGVALPQAATPALNLPAVAPPASPQEPIASPNRAPVVVPMPGATPGGSANTTAGQTDQGGMTGTGSGAQQTQPTMAWPNDWEPRKIAHIQALDKVNAQVRVLTVPVGQSATFGSLTIAVTACVVRPKNEPPDAAAFLVVTDSHPNTQGFKGWMLEDEPSVSMMEHPLYDLRVVGCG